MGLYSAFGGNPYSYIDALGLDDELVVPVYVQGIRQNREFVERLIDQVNEVYKQADIRFNLVEFRNMGKCPLLLRNRTIVKNTEEMLFHFTRTNSIEQLEEKAKGFGEELIYDKMGNLVGITNSTYYFGIPLESWSENFWDINKHLEAIYDQWYNESSSLDVPILAIVGAPQASSYGRSVGYLDKDPHEMDVLKSQDGNIKYWNQLTEQEKLAKEELANRYRHGVAIVQGENYLLGADLGHEFAHILSQSGFHYKFAHGYRHHILLYGYDATARPHIPEDFAKIMRAYILQRWPNQDLYKK